MQEPASKWPKAINEVFFGFVSDVVSYKLLDFKAFERNYQIYFPWTTQLNFLDITCEDVAKVPACDDIILISKQIAKFLLTHKYMRAAFGKSKLAVETD